MPAREALPRRLSIRIENTACRVLSRPGIAWRTGEMLRGRHVEVRTCSLPARPQRAHLTGFPGCHDAPVPGRHGGVRCNGTGMRSVVGGCRAPDHVLSFPQIRVHLVPSRRGSSIRLDLALPALWLSTTLCKPPWADNQSYLVNSEEKLLTRQHASWLMTCLGSAHWCLSRGKGRAVFNAGVGARPAWPRRSGSDCTASLHDRED